MADKIGLLAGAGELPRCVIEACRRHRREIFVLAFEGSCAPATVAGVPHRWLRLGAAATGLRLLRDEGVRELLLAGAIRRPSLWELRPDWRIARFLAKVGLRALTDWGDDALFRAIIAELEQEGFQVIGIDAVLAELLAPLGPLGRTKPDEQAQADIEIGIAAARAHGGRDLGQAVIVRQGAVIGVEDRDGTDALMRRCAESSREHGGLLVKMAKPGQERRVDLPAIGPETIASAAAAGLRGIAIEANATLVLDRDVLVDAADLAGIFVVGVAPGLAA